MIGYAFSGSYCTLAASLRSLEMLIAEGYDVLPILSDNVRNTDTRFFLASEFYSKVEKTCGRKPISTIAEAEPLGPKNPIDALVVAPCTGNSLAKIANGITDTPLTMAVKAHLRSDRPLLIALASNDAMSQNLSNLARLMTRRSVYFVPMVEDDPKGKPYSLVAKMSEIPTALALALRGVQMRPIFLG